jgi:GNAT superfamily N-acetyltransferase
MEQKKVKSICVHCGKNITHQTGNLWHIELKSTSPKHESLFPQYCWVNESLGSQLHAPPPGVLHLMPAVPEYTLPLAFVIEEAVPSDKGAYLHMLRDYLSDDEDDLVAEIMDVAPIIFDTRFMVRDSPMRCFFARSYSDPVGFIVINVHDHNWTLKKICYIEDLFVMDSARHRGVGTDLVNHVKMLALLEDWHHVYWTTGDDNEAAQSIYDKVAKREPVIKYKMDIP